MTNSRTSLVLLTLGMLIAAGLIQGAIEQTESVVSPPAEQPVLAMSLPGIENLIQVAPGLICGGQPIGDQAFSGLRARGVQVIVSVDGTPPNVSAAERQGLRYIHLPIGYDGIAPQTRADLHAAMQLAPQGTVFIHCHHGKHRGPAAAAYAGLASGKLSLPAGLELLSLAGTKPEYSGLWKAIRNYEPPALPPRPLVATAPVEPLVAAMVRIDHSWDTVQEALDKPVTGADPSHHDANLIANTLLLAEQFQELSRQPLGPDESFRRLLEEAGTATRLLHEHVAKGDSAMLPSAAKRVSEACARCHADYRD